MPSDLPLTASDLRSLLADGDLQEIAELLIDHPTLQPLFHHFTSLSRVLSRLEELHRLTQLDLQQVVEDMTHNDFNDAFTFFLACRRQECGTPYSRPPRYTQHPSPSTSTCPSSTVLSSAVSSIISSPSSLPDPNDIDIQQTSYDTPPIGHLVVTPPLGSVSHPIDVDRFPTPPLPAMRYGTPVPSVGILLRLPRPSRPIACHACHRPNRHCTACRWRQDS